MSILHLRKAITSLLAGFFLTAAGASAQLIGIRNLETPKTSDLIVDLNQSLGAMFTTGSSGLWDLSSVDLHVGDLSTSPNGDFHVALYSVAGSLPDQKIVDFTGPNPSTYGDYSYTPDSTATLQPSTSYYIVASGTPDSGFYVWGATSSTATLGMSGWTLFVGDASTVGGVWGLSPGSDTPQMAVNVTAAVPEPASMALLGTAGAFLGGLALRRRRL